MSTSPEATDVRFAPAAARNPETPGWWAFAQHRGWPTRLLDFTANPLVALYFATELGSDDTDGFVYGLHVSGRVATQDLENMTYLNCFDWELPTGTTPWVRFEVSEPNDWMLAQAGGFAWCPTMGESWNGGVIKIRVPAEDKAKIRAQLFLFGITRELLFPPEVPTIGHGPSRPTGR